MKNTHAEILQERRNLFEKMYEETFGQKISLSGHRKEEGTLVLNFYGVKSNWL